MLAGVLATVVAYPARRTFACAAARLIAGPSTNGSRFALWEAGGADQSSALLGAADWAVSLPTVGDVYQLAFDDATFDVVHAHQVLQHEL